MITIARRRVWLFAFATAAATGLASRSLAQLVAANDAADASIFLLDIEGISPPRALVTGSNAPTGAIAADPRGTLYWISGQQTLVRAAYNQTGALTPTVVGVLLVGGAPAANFTGLAFDSTAHRLYAYCNSGTLGSEGFYEVNPTTRECTLVWPAPAAALDFGAFDYDPVGDVFYGVNDSVVALPSGRGLYRLRQPLAAAIPELVVASPNNDGDIDGLAIGGGRAYLINDAPAQGVYVYDLVGGTFLPTLPLPFPAGGTFAGGAWAPELVAANASVELLVPSGCAIAPGAEFEYSILVRNVGPDTAKDGVLESLLPASAAFVSSSPAGTLDAGTLRVALGHFPANESRLIRVRLRAPASGTLAFDARVRSRTTDPVVSNNAAMLERAVGTGATPNPTSIQVVVSTLARSASSLVGDPGVPGARYASTGSGGVGLGRVRASSDGRRYVFASRTTAGAEDRNDMLFLVENHGTPRILVREGVTAMPEGLVARGTGSASPFGASMALAADGTLLFSWTDGSARAVASRWSAGMFTNLARQGAACDALAAGATYAGAIFGMAQSRSGTPFLLARAAGTGVTPANDTLVLRHPIDILARAGFTIPSGQEGDRQDTLRSITMPTPTAGDTMSVDSTGGRLLYRAMLNSPDGTRDEALVLDGVVVIQEGVVLAGSSFTVPVREPALFSRFLGDGSWIALGSNQGDPTAGASWVVRDGRVVAAAGDAVTPCSTRRWLGSATAGAFVAFGGNARGDVVLIGTTDDAPSGGVMLVLNASRVLARRGDALDLDANGLFDDDAYIDQFLPYHLEVTDREIFCTVALASASPTNCGELGTYLADAILRIALPCPADTDDGSGTGATDGGVTVDDLIYYLGIFAQGLPQADVDDGTGTGRIDCGVTIDDLVYYLVRFGEGC